MSKLKVRQKISEVNSRGLNQDKPHIYFWEGVWRCTWPRNLVMRRGTLYKKWLAAREFIHGNS